MRRLVPIIILAAALLLGARVGMEHRWDSPRLGPSLRVDFIDVGQGDSILIHTPDGANALVDAGEAESGPRIVEHLKRAGVQRLDLLVLTHPHSDHVGGMPAVFESFPVGDVLDSGYVHGSEVQEAMLRRIEREKLPYHRARAGMEIALGQDARLEVLSPPERLFSGTDSDANNNSVVLRLVYGRVKILLAGDIEQEAEGELIASHRDLESQVLKVANHGASDSTSLEFLRLVRPEYVVISVGAHNEYGYPSRTTLGRLSEEKTGATVLRTDTSGTVSVLTDGRRIVVEKER